MTPASRQGGRHWRRRLMLLVCGCSLYAGSGATRAEPEPLPLSPQAPGVPLSTVVLTLADPSPVLGVTSTTELHIEVEHPFALPMPLPRLLCSTGQVEDVVRAGPATFTARYVLPAGRFPQPAILVAEFEGTFGLLRGMVWVRLRATATQTLHTDPGAQVTIRIGDRDFGPDAAHADGFVSLPVVVPPGVDFALARSVNQHGKATEQVVDLRVPYSQRLLLAAPQTLTAGSVAEIAVYAAEPSGRPARASEILVRAPEGSRVHPLGSRLPGEARFLLTAPLVLREQRMRVEALLKGQNTTLVATSIALIPGKAASLRLAPEAPRLDRRKGAWLRVFLAASDAAGNTIDARRASVLIDGNKVEIQAGPQGQPMVIASTPAAFDAQDSVLVEAVLDESYATQKIPIGVQRKPARADHTTGIALPRVTLTARLGVQWNLGEGSGANLFLDTAVFPSKRYPGLGLGLSIGAMQTQFAAESLGGISHAGLTALPILFEMQQRFFAGDTFFAMSAGAGFALAFARIQSYGASVSGHSYGAAAQATAETGLSLHRGQLVVSLRYLSLRLASLSSGDHIAGNPAGALADFGYRLGW